MTSDLRRSIPSPSASNSKEPLRQYAGIYKVSRCDGDCWEIQGKRGYVRPLGESLELYCTSTNISRRIERQNKPFVVTNRYDDATAFVFSDDAKLLTLATGWIKAKKRKHYSPEQRLAMAARMRSWRLKPKQEGTSRKEYGPSEGIVPPKAPTCVFRH